MHEIVGIKFEKIISLYLWIFKKNDVIVRLATSRREPLLNTPAIFVGTVKHATRIYKMNKLKRLYIITVAADFEMFGQDVD